MTFGDPLSGLSTKLANTWCGGDSRCPAGPVTPPPTPDEWVPVGIPVHCRFLHRGGDLIPRLEPPALQGQRSQDLPPRLDQVQVGCRDRLEHELPPRVRQVEQ